jgi:DNA-binding MarR family transcriptional regulator
MIVLKSRPKVNGSLNMMTNYGAEELSVVLCRMVNLTYTRFKNGMDQAFSEQRLTMEQFLVLLNIKYNDVPMRITDLAHWLERSTNSMSMLVDRMVKAGLLRRVRDRRDRRVVNVSLTNKGEIALERASPAAWEFNQLCMSPLSYEDKCTLANLFKMINCKLVEHLNPGADAEEMVESDIRKRDYVMKKWRKQVHLTTPEVKRSSSRTKKTQPPAEEQ